MFPTFGIRPFQWTMDSSFPVLPASLRGMQPAKLRRRTSAAVEWQGMKIPWCQIAIRPSQNIIKRRQCKDWPHKEVKYYIIRMILNCIFRTASGYNLINCWWCWEQFRRPTTWQYLSPSARSFIEQSIHQCHILIHFFIFHQSK